eukprot:CAMPEP_0171736752 /NCGR_PEP_ID=MMETSP0991-20121206/32464_1 /TAXON_ID=483369 /ORGANISM="non described non described, Strain CCMP2098" /LENGTH=42 /DNA_ID= /DNA_START= /DNA_END= /DNA_ORIENTATION=
MRSRGEDASEIARTAADNEYDDDNDDARASFAPKLPGFLLRF